MKGEGRQNRTREEEGERKTGMHIAARRRKAFDKRKKKRERGSHWECWKIKKEGKGNKQRKSKPLRRQEWKSRRTKTFAQIETLTSI